MTRGWGRICEALAVLAGGHGRPDASEGRVPRMVRDYDAPAVSDKIVRIILSYTDYVRRVVWREE